MSRYYEMSVAISGHKPDRADAVTNAAAEEWPFEDWWGGNDGDNNDHSLHASGRDCLYGGESEEEFTERLSLAVWKANGAFCSVVVDATFLEDLPCETHTLDESDYARLMAAEEVDSGS